MKSRSLKIFEKSFDIFFFLSASSVSNSSTLHLLTFSSTSFGIEESVGIFLLGLILVFILWITVCCVCFIRCHQLHNDNDDGNCQLLSIRPSSSSQKTDLRRFTILSESKPMIVGNLYGHTSTGGIENLSLHINPLENQHLSSLKITQID